MREILDRISLEMKRHGYKHKSVSISHLPEVQEAVAKLVRQGMISEKLHSTWHFYLDSNNNLPEAKTIFVVAMPEPITCVKFAWQGKVLDADIPPNYIYQADENRAAEVLNNVLKPHQYQIAKAHLALKTLAVRSGLARYGKNNITYVPGMGSFHRLIAFYSDCPCEEDHWHKVSIMKACENCSRCRENCHAGSISTDRFLIHAEKCYAFYYDRKILIPDRIPPSWHIPLFACLSCQLVCPVNKPHLNTIADGPIFSEQETALLLKKIPWEDLPQQTQYKLTNIGFDDSERYSLLPNNLGVLIKSQNL
jgi:epoxyqueuosine reductase